MMGVSTWPLEGQLGDHHEQIIRVSLIALLEPATDRLMEPI
jgi:hypothetical protein